MKTPYFRRDVWLEDLIGKPAFWIESSSFSGKENFHEPAFYQARCKISDLSSLGKLQNAGFEIMDVNGLFSLAARPPSISSVDGVFVRLAQSSDREILSEIAARELTVNRFHHDPKIPESTAREIKARWVNSFFEGNRGDWMVVAEVSDAVAGFLLIRERDPSTAIIDLIATKANHRGQGVGRAMIRHAIFDLQLHNKNLLVGTSLANVSATIFYGNFGFRIVESDFLLHFHTRGPSN